VTGGKGRKGRGQAPKIFWPRTGRGQIRRVDNPNSTRRKSAFRLVQHAVLHVSLHVVAMLVNGTLHTSNM